MANRRIGSRTGYRIGAARDGYPLGTSIAKAWSFPRQRMSSAERLALTGGGIRLESLDCYGAWLSLVERLVRDQEVASSNLVAPIENAEKNGAFRRVIVLAELWRYTGAMSARNDSDSSQRLCPATKIWLGSGQRRPVAIAANRLPRDAHRNLDDLAHNGCLLPAVCGTRTSGRMARPNRSRLKPTRRPARVQGGHDRPGRRQDPPKCFAGSVTPRDARIRPARPQVARLTAAN